MPGFLEEKSGLASKLKAMNFNDVEEFDTMCDFDDEPEEESKDD